MAGVADIFGGNVTDKAGKVVDLKTHCAGKVVGIYFSAHWCPPCRGFTPVLAKFYAEHHQDKKFEVIFVSCDRDQKSFDAYYNEMPWLKLEFKEKGKQEEICEKYSVNGIPKFILLNGDSGEVINEDGRTGVASGNAAGFPWKR